ncbi:MAG: hypothetical protein V7695_03145 [Sulfitobacter sp.]
MTAPTSLGGLRGAPSVLSGRCMTAQLGGPVGHFQNCSQYLRASSRFFSDTGVSSDKQSAPHIH